MGWQRLGPVGQPRPARSPVGSRIVRWAAAGPVRLPLGFPALGHAESDDAGTFRYGIPKCAGVLGAGSQRKASGESLLAGPALQQRQRVDWLAASVPAAHPDLEVQVRARG